MRDILWWYNIYFVLVPSVLLPALVTGEDTLDIPSPLFYNQSFDMTCQAGDPNQTMQATFYRSENQNSAGVTVAIIAYYNSECIHFKLEGSYTYRCELSTGKIYLTATADINDDGTYWRCSPAGVAASTVNQVLINVIDFVKSVSLQYPVGSSSPETVKIIDDTELTLTCVTSPCLPQATVTWVRTITGTQNSSTASSGKRIITTSYLQIVPRTTDQEQSIMCTASNYQGQEVNSSKITLDILYKPTISQLISPYKVIQGRQFDVTCSATGNPNTTSYRWTGPGISPVKSARLQIDNVSSSTHAGTFTCRAQNTLSPTVGAIETGEDTRTLVLDVLYKPIVSQLTSPYKVLHGRQLDVTCSATGNPNSITYSWTGPGISQVNAAHLQIASVSYLTHAGTFTCSAQNSMTSTSGATETGVDTKTLSLDVLYPPSIIVIPTKNVYQGATLTVTCQASGNPVPTYRWTKSGDDSFIQSGATLTLSNIQPNSAGTYMCHAENTMISTGISAVTSGSDKTNFTVNVLFPTEPDRPTLLSIVAIIESVVVLQWTSQFNGGAAQSFIVQYRQRVAENWTDTNVVLSDPGQNETVYYVLHGIDLHDDYSVRVFAQNAVGKSSVTDEVIANADTQSVSSECPLNSQQTETNSVGIALGVTCAILGTILLVCSVLLIVQKKRLMIAGKASLGERTKTKEIVADYITPTYDEVQNSSEPENDENIISKEMTYETQCKPVAIDESQYEQLQSGISDNGKKVYQNTSI